MSKVQRPVTQALYERLFECSPDAVVVVDRDGCILEVNPQVELLFGYARGELLGCRTHNPVCQVNSSEFSSRASCRSNLQDLDLADAKPTKNRNLYFSEVLQDPNNPLGPTNFYLTEGSCSSAGGIVTCTGPTPTLFSPNNPPALVTTQRSVEDWTIQNTAMENHAFHIHNLHFRVVAFNGVPLPEDQQSYQDVYMLPFWDGVSAFPSVTVRLDFRGADVGDVLYECTFLTHADFGMRAFIRVLPDQQK